MAQLTTPAIRQYITDRHRAGDRLKLIAANVESIYGVKITVGHICSIAVDNGSKKRRLCGRQQHAVIYDRPPFYYKGKLAKRLKKCGHLGWESKAYPGYCYECEMQGIPQKDKRVDRVLTQS